MLGRVKGYRVCSESSEAPLGPMFFTSLRSMSALDRRHAWDGGGGAGILPEHEQLAQLGGAALSAQKSCSSCSVVLKCSLSCFKQNPQSDFLDPFSWQSRGGLGSEEGKGGAQLKCKVPAMAFGKCCSSCRGLEA